MLLGPRLIEQRPHALRTATGKITILLPETSTEMVADSEDMRHMLIAKSTVSY